MTASVSVIIPHYNDLERLDECLVTLDRQLFPREQFEIIVADNASPCGFDAIEGLIAGRAKLTICHERGAGPTRNAGIAAAGHRHLAFIDSDCLADQAWLASGVAALEAPDPPDIVGGKVSVSVHNPGQRSGAEAFEQVFAFDNRAYVRDQHFSVTANLFTRRDVFETVGGFRTGVSEDKEWCLRAKSFGYRIAYGEAAVVTHPARPDWAALLLKWRRLQSESYLLALERPRGRIRWLLRSWALPASILPHGLEIFKSPALANAGERRRALATLIRLRLWRFADAHRLLLQRKTGRP